MLLGLGAGMGFIYWQMRMGPSTSIFVGGRGNAKNFFSDLSKRIGVRNSRGHYLKCRQGRGFPVAGSR